MGRKIYQNIALGLLAALSFSACEKVENTPVGSGVPPSNVMDRNVYVVCEGSLGNGNASLSAYTPGKAISYFNVYQSANGQLLGDVFQSMQLIDDKLFLCVNNSDKIVVLNEDDKKEVGTISLSKPRYIQAISAKKAYVTSIFSNKVHIIDPEKMTVTGSISMPAQNPEGIALVNDKVYVCCWDTLCSSIYVIDTGSNMVVDSIPLSGKAPHDILVDKSGLLWVMAGNATQKNWATLSYVQPSTRQVIRYYQFPEYADPTKMAYSSSMDRLYFLMVDYNGNTNYNGVYTMTRQSTELPKEPLIDAVRFQYFWGLGVDPVTDDIYVADPKGFVQKGTVSVHNTDGSLKSTFSVGVGPGNFYFDK